MSGQPIGSDAETRGQVVQILCAAASPDAQLRVPAHQKLQELENRPGFAGVLLEAYADSATAPQGRYLAILMCKNVVDRQWRPQQGKGMLPEDKRHTKQLLEKLLAGAVTGALPHLLELTVVTRRVCRFDFPKEWDELAHFLLAGLKGIREQGFSESGLATIMVLHHVLKEQATKRLLSSRREFQQIAQVLTEPLGAVWVMALEQLRHALAPGGPGAGDDRIWKLSRYLDGCFMILLAQGFAHLHNEATGPQMILLAREKVTLLVGLLQTQPILLVQCPFFHKNIKSVLKWWAILINNHPLAFAQADVGKVLGMSCEVMQKCAQLQADPQARQVADSLIRSSLQMLTYSMNCKAFRQGPGPTHQGAALEMAGTCHGQFAEFLRSHSVASLCDLLLLTALQPAPEDLWDWLSDPEDQVLGPGSLTELRIAGEGLVRALGQAPLDAQLVEYVAKRMQQDMAQPPTVGDSFELVARRDAFFSLISICHATLRPHLQFRQLLGFAEPLATIASALAGQSGGTQAPAVILPVRLCSVIRAWSAEVKADVVPPLLQLLQGFLHADCPKAIRLAALGPLRELVSRFSDHEAWAQAQGPLIDSCLGLLGCLQSPEVQWRCLNLVHLFMCEEAESGRYEVTERSLGQLLSLWRQPEGGEELVRLALLDVLRAMVLMSCRSKKPRLPLSPPLLNGCLAVVSECFANRSAAAEGGAGSTADGRATTAALDADAGLAAERLGEQASGAATLFDSGSALFLGVLRTVDVEQVGPLFNFFPSLLQHYGKASSLHDSALDILLEYVALYLAVPGGLAQLEAHHGPLLVLCRQGLEAAAVQREGQDSSGEVCLRLVQLVLANTRRPESLAALREIASPLLRLWCTTFHAKASPASLKFPLHALCQVFCAWYVHHTQDFAQQLCAAGANAAHAAGLLVASCKLVRPIALRASLLAVAAGIVAEEGAVMDEAFWGGFFQCCNEIINSAQKKGPSSLLSQTLQAMKSSLATKLPLATRSAGELQCSIVPGELRQALREDGTLDEATVVRWLFGLLAGALRVLGTKGTNVQGLLGAAPEQVQGALRSAGL